MATYYVYILTNKNHTVLYTGFTDDLERRVYEHKNKLLPGLTKKYNCDKLVYYETFGEAEDALHREKKIKHYKKEWKHNLIRDLNPDWNDLYFKFSE